MSGILPFENEASLPNQQSPLPSSMLNNITNPNDLLVGLLYDIYFTPGRGHATRLPRGRRTRTRKQKNRKSRRQRKRAFQKNYASHMWGKIIFKRHDHIVVRKVNFTYNDALDQFEEIEIDEIIIPHESFYYANLETLNEKLEDPYFELLTEPYRKLLTMYAAEQSIPYGASVFASVI